MTDLYTTVTKQNFNVTVAAEVSKALKVNWRQKLKSNSPLRVPPSIEKSEDRYFLEGLKQLRAWKPQKRNSVSEGIQVIDMFCGGGGMSSGFAAIGKANKGFELIGGIDVNSRSLESYENNYGVPGMLVDVRDLSSSKESVSEFLESLPRYDSKRKTVLIGCAPCQGFTAHRKKKWNEPDERNGLVEAFADVAAHMEPECVIMENVPELLSGRYWKHFEYFKNKMESKGYIVKGKIHNAATQGVAQERFRALVVAMKHDFSLPKARLEPKSYITVRDAIGKLEKVESGVACEHDSMHRCASHRASTIETIKAVPIDGGSRPDGIGPKCLQNFKGYADVYGRLAWDKPAITITHYARNPASGRFVHPSQHRGLTMREAARLQSFPDGFAFSGGFDDVFRQIGEAVPPLLSLATAACVLSNLRNESELTDDNVVTLPVNDSFAGVIAGIKGLRKCAP